MSETIKRPTASETDEDLIQMQEEWSQINKKPSVEVHKMKKRTKIDGKSENLAENQSKIAENPPKLPQNVRDQAARFQLDLDSNSSVSTVLFGVQERNFDVFDAKNGEKSIFSAENLEFSREDGFPEPLDLSDYFKPKSGRSLATVPPGRSFFAAEFDRIHGNLAENLDCFQAENQSDDVEDSGDFHVENEKYLKSLDSDKILEMKLEIQERFDPKLLDFLKNRGKSAKNEEKTTKISKFKASRLKKETESSQKGAEPSKEEAEPKEAEPVTKEVEEMMNELEVLEEWKNQEDQEKYNRLATDAIQLDLTAKFSRNLAQRQQKNALKLFDNCKIKPENSPSNALLDLARASIDQIKHLYLEEISTDSGATVTQQFGKGLNPILDSCWSLIPIRRVLDTVERRHLVTSDDVEIVRLAILWTFLLFSERKSAFFAFSQPNDFYIHLTEILMIGNEILMDDVIMKCLQNLLNEYVIPQAKEGRISLRMSGKVAGLDAFMPFYEQLLRNYEQYSMGDASFATAILIGAYLNAPVGDSIEYRCSLWSPKRAVIRQMTVTTSSCRDLFDGIKRQTIEKLEVICEQYYVQYCTLLGHYVTAIRDNVITRDRNQLMFDIASFEIGKFMENQRNRPEKQKEFQILVDIIQKSIGDKLDFL